MNRPPKNSTSVTRNAHMPSTDASNCCSSVSKWCWSAGGCVSWEWATSANLHLRPGRVVVRRLGHDRGLLEVLGGRRRRNLPFQALGAPRVRRGPGAGEERVGEVDGRDEV